MSANRTKGRGTKSDIIAGLMLLPNHTSLQIPALKESERKREREREQERERERENCRWGLFKTYFLF